MLRIGRMGIPSVSLVRRLGLVFVAGFVFDCTGCSTSLKSGGAGGTSGTAGVGAGAYGGEGGTAGLGGTGGQGGWLPATDGGSFDGHRGAAGFGGTNCWSYADCPQSSGGVCVPPDNTQVCGYCGGPPYMPGCQQDSNCVSDAG